MKIKVFNFRNVWEAQSTINEWFEEQGGKIKITHITQTESAAVNDFWNLTYSLFYEDKKK